MARYHTTGRAVCNVQCGKWIYGTPDREFVPDGSYDFHRKYSPGSPFIVFKPIVHRSWLSRAVLRVRRSRWIEVDVPASGGSGDGHWNQKWRVSVTKCRGETDTDILDGAYEHVRNELKIIETLIQWRRDIPVATRPVAWSYRLPDGTHPPVVYFMRNGTRVKIGTTSHIRNRVRRLALRPENVALITPGDRDAEHAFHQRFATYRVGDTEWFDETGTLRDFIETERLGQRS